MIVMIVNTIAIMIVDVELFIFIIIIKIVIILNFYNYNHHCHCCLIMMRIMVVLMIMIIIMMMGLAWYYDFVVELTGQTDKPRDESCTKILFLRTHPPCYIIVANASSQDNGVSCIRNPACQIYAVA